LNINQKGIKGGHPLMPPSLKPILTFILLAFTFSYIQFSVPWLIGYDGYFHIKLSLLIREEGFIKSLPYLEFTIYRDYFRDHHLLFHYLLAPFTYGDMIHNGKIAVALFATIAGTVFYIVINRLGVRCPAMWTVVAMLSSHAFLYRISLLRVQSLALAFLLASFLLLTKGKNIALFLLSVAFVWLYDAFPLFIAMAMAFGMACWLTERRSDLTPLFICLIGILTGLVINPYFPENIQSFLYNMSRTIFFNITEVDLGVEWAPYSTWNLIRSSIPAFILLFITILYLPFRKALRVDEYASLILNLLYLILAFKSRRFIEYWPVFSVLSASLIIGRRISWKVMTAGMIVLMPFLFLNVKNATTEVRSSVNPRAYEGASLWLKANSNDKDIVFNADWDDFPFLFFYNTKNRYIVGLDPMYMYTFDRDKYRIYKAITEGRVVNPGRLIRKEFNARYVFLDRTHDELYRTLEHDPVVKKVYEDRGALVFEVLGGHWVE
jgi:hypothetical protein